MGTLVFVIRGVFNEFLPHIEIEEDPVSPVEWCENLLTLVLQAIDPTVDYNNELTPGSHSCGGISFQSVVSIYLNDAFDNNLGYTQYSNNLFEGK